MSEQRAGRGLRGLFGRPQPAPAAAPDGRYGFDYLPADSVYLDSACQTMRPQPVIDAVTAYYTEDNACGGRVRYDAGRRVDELGVLRRAGEHVVVEPGWRADGGPCPGADRLFALLDGTAVP